MNEDFKINLDLLNDIYSNEFKKSISTKIEEIINNFTNSLTYKELSSSSILNFNNYIDRQKNVLTKIRPSFNSLSDYFREIIDNHTGIDLMLRESSNDLITDPNTISILSSIKKLSTYDRTYNEKSNNVIIEYKPSFSYLISKSNITFSESSIGVDITDVDYNKEYPVYEEESELKEATSFSSLY